MHFLFIIQHLLIFIAVCWPVEGKEEGWNSILYMYKFPIVFLI